MVLLTCYVNLYSYFPRNQVQGYLVAIYKSRESPDVIEASILKTLSELFRIYPNKLFLIDLSCHLISISRPKSIVAYLCLLLDYFDSSDLKLKNYSIQKVVSILIYALSFALNIFR